MRISLALIPLYCALSLSSGLAQQVAPKLLPTSALAIKAKALEKALADHAKRDTRQRDFARLKSLVSDFVIRQLEAYPPLAPQDLRRQVRLIVRSEWSASDESEGPPYALASGWGPKATIRTWLVAYEVWLGYHGVGGSAVVIDSYVWENGTVRLAGRGGEMSGHALEADEISPGRLNAISVLVHGVLRGSSGQALNGRAALYTVDAAGVHTVWQTARLPGLRAFGHYEQFLVTYVDAKRFYPYPQLPQPHVMEFYVIEKGAPRLAVRQNY